MGELSSPIFFMSSGTLYASFKFDIECPTKADFDWVLGLCDTDELSNRICECEDDEVEVKACQRGNKPSVKLRLYDVEVRNEIDDVINELQAKLKERGMKLDGYVQFVTEDGEHTRGDFSTDENTLDYMSTDCFLGYSVKQLRELRFIATQKWGKPDEF